MEIEDILCFKGSMPLFSTQIVLCFIAFHVLCLFNAVCLFGAKSPEEKVE